MNSAYFFRISIMRLPGDLGSDIAAACATAYQKIFMEGKYFDRSVARGELE